MVRRKPEHKKSKNVLTTVSPEDYSFVKKHNLRWADLLRNGIDFARQKVEREEREKYFNKGFKQIEPEIKSYMKESNIPYNKECYDRAIYITRGQYTFGDIPINCIRDLTVFQAFIQNYIDISEMKRGVKKFISLQKRNLKE